ncbi:MAG: dTDP-4-dehydrorhamnose reductase [Candidatus Nanohaloarchaea archaeon]
MKYLVTGSNGQVGESLEEKVDDFVGLDIREADLTGDISNEEIVEKVVEENPDAVIHAAAMTDLDKAERNPERAREVNIKGTENICLAAEKAGAHLVYISTDYVFDGERGDYSEDDEPAPKSVYSRTKLEGERAVRDASVDSTVMRTSVVFRENHDNFFTWAKTELEEKGEVGAITDQVCCPTYAPNLAEFIVEAVEKDLTGTYHVAGDSKLSRYEAVQIMKEELGLEGEVKRMKMEDLPWEAHRPKNSSLSLAKAKKDFDSKPISISETLHFL